MGDGNGVTEMISACAFDVVANGVGHYSFTHALTTELRLLSRRVSFPVSELYIHIYCRAQHHLPQGIANERFPAPIHLQLTRGSIFARGLHLSVRALPAAHDAFPTNNSSSISGAENSQTQSPPPGLCHLTDMKSDDGPDTCNRTAAILRSTSSPMGSSNYFTFPEPDPVETSPPQDSPRLLLAIRFIENIAADDLSVELFREWLRIIPAAVEDVKIEAGCQYDSTQYLLRALQIRFKKGLNDWNMLVFMLDLLDLDDSSKTGSRKLSQIFQSMRAIEMHFKQLKDIQEKLIALKESLAQNLSMVRKTMSDVTYC